jgi:hypothetical protein
LIDWDAYICDAVENTQQVIRKGDVCDIFKIQKTISTIGPVQV